MAGLREHHGGDGGHGNRSNSSSSIPYLNEERCPICFESLSKVRMEARGNGSPYAPSTALGGVVICDCGHGFCEDCLTQYVRIAICEGGTRLGMLRCPMNQCNVPMQESLLKKLASPGDWKKHLQYNEARKIEERPSLRFCPQPKCDGVAVLSHLVQAEDIGRFFSVQCNECGHDFCANCASSPHEDKHCDQAGRQDYFEWKQGKDVKPCPGCGNHVELSGGCRMMRCPRCRVKWCWECALPLDLCKHPLENRVYSCVTTIGQACTAIMLAPLGIIYYAMLAPLMIMLAPVLFVFFVLKALFSVCCR